MTSVESITSLSLQIRLFGPVDVRIGGDPLRRLRSRKGAWLVALLVLRHGREVSRDWLAGTLLPDSEEAQAMGHPRHGLTELRSAPGREAHPVGLPPPPHRGFQ